jgi:hypothetical protein
MAASGAKAPSPPPLPSLPPGRRPPTLEVPVDGVGCVSAGKVLKASRSRGDGMRVQVRFDGGDEHTYSLPKDAAHLRLAGATTN